MGTGKTNKKAYDPSEIEHRWGQKWFDANLYKAEDFLDKPKKYILAELPYPSGKSIHIGHAMRYTVPEVYSRYLRMCGYNVMFPMAWDSFGLPTEGYALESGRTPQEVTEELTKSYKKAMQGMGYAIDWDREFATSDPQYYKWTQWLFLKFYEQGLAVLKEMPVWWCKELGNLADEEVLTDKDGNKTSERGGYKVEKKLFKQWVLKIPEYAEKLLSGLEKTDFPNHIKTAQVNWIGKTEGCNIKFNIRSGDGKFSKEAEVYTTRPDTLYGVTFIVLAPEHPLVRELVDLSKNSDEVRKYAEKVRNLSDMDKQTLKVKTGVRLEGVLAHHPFEEVTRDIPVFVGNYVLMETGTGVVMGVPAHDERDFEFAKKYGLAIIPVIKPENKDAFLEEAYTDGGIMINSNEFDGLSNSEGATKITQKLEGLMKGRKATNYKIRDWVFSRQRYWGEPIPVVYTNDGTVEAIAKTEDSASVSEKLPLELPYSREYEPTKDGEPPLSRVKNWVKTTDSEGRPAKRETQTMPTWAGSCWYYLRYIDPKNNDCFADQEKLKYWLPVDKYFGGAEHTTVHLLYSRFWHQFFYDLGLVPTEEPYQSRTNGGILLAEDGRKMSKRFGNVVEPQFLVDNYGADATRMALCFLGPYTDTYPWNSNTIKATWRFLNTVYDLRVKVKEGVQSDSTEKQHYGAKELEKQLHKTIKNVTEMIEDLKMNTVVSQLMILVNTLKTQERIEVEAWKSFVKMLAPIAPFLAEELWQEINGFGKWIPENSVHMQSWPKYDEKLAREDFVVLGVQINGKIRAEVEVAVDEPEDSVKEKVLKIGIVQKYLENNPDYKFIYVPNRIVSIVVR